MKLANCSGFVEKVMKQTIPMHGRMIHGRGGNGTLWEESQAYDVHGRVSSNGLLCLLLLGGP